eukprot:748161-Hanusia_phi.AAC.1
MLTVELPRPGSDRPGSPSPISGPGARRGPVPHGRRPAACQVVGLAVPRQSCPVAPGCESDSGLTRASDTASSCRVPQCHGHSI